MKIEEILLHIPPALRKVIENDGKVSEQLEEGIPLAQILQSERVFEGLLKSMKTWESDVLTIIVRKFASQMFDFPSLQRTAQNTAISGAELLTGLTLLRRKGIVFAMRKHWGECSYFLPTNAFGIWQGLLMADNAVVLQDDKNIELELSPDRGIVFELFFLLVYIAQHEIILTKKGLLPKRHIVRLSGILCLNEALLCKWNPHFLASNPYPPAVAVILDLAFRLNLIQLENQRIQLCSPHVDQWLQKSMIDMNQVLYSTFLDVFKPNDAELEHFITKVETTLEHKWHLLDEIVHWMQEYDIIHSYKPKSHVFLPKDWLELLAAFGWLELGSNNEGRTAFRWLIHLRNASNNTSLPGKFYVQPDYEILVPPDVCFSIRFELAYMADHQHTDQVGVYRITQESIFRAMMNGKSIDQCLHFLTQHSLYEIPDNIAKAIVNWSQSNEIRKLLPKKAIPDKRSNMDLSEIPQSNHFEWYEIESSLPSRNEIYPLWREIPTIWWKECRNYHASTRKEIIQQAIAWQAIVKLRSEHSEWMIIPKEVQENDAGWSFYGMERSDSVHYTPNQWQAMQLILPGFHDLD
ncbi:MAG: putative helicase [Bacilli bacterium]|nr:putative helicase [Bacilli bacterium]